MAGQTSESAALELEWEILRAICGGSRALRKRAAQTLKRHRWRNAVHQAIFESLVRFPLEAPEVPRDRLAAILTRKGFPDIDWEGFFLPLSLSQEEVQRLVRQISESKDARREA